MPLNQDEIEACRNAFLAFDADNSGTIDVWELRQVLQAMGHNPSEEQVFELVSEVDTNLSGTIDFAEFIVIIEKQKERAAKIDESTDLVDAFVACGGNRDCTGHVKRDTLIRIIKDEFELSIDIEDMITKLDTDGSGELEYDEFKALLS